MASAWITFVKDFAKKNNLKYNEALKSADCKKEYHASKGKGLEVTKCEEIPIEPIVEEVTVIKKARGRPKKYTTANEALQAKNVKSGESNMRRAKNVVIKEMEEKIKDHIKGDGIEQDGLATHKGDLIYPLSMNDILKLLGK